MIWVNIVLSALMAFAIGANDAANGLATAYGSKVMSLKKLIVMGAVAEFIGAMFCSSRVSSTLGEAVILNLETLENDVQEILMLSVCLASFLFIMTSSLWKMPISGTHTVVGALLGAGLF